ncbi:RISC-loading complex subunit TARBP2 [Chelonia mydas]|uniref:RISC-loading complex subunit TARBP2 n=1 Tax=Chelonia mydas TaxID=8469 RepID=M7BDK2_CHEMY|nr:RISC-loading complex subunit TARBP2 [Chelonia mydas]
MLASNPGKTPISLLQEYGTRIGKTPVYDLLKAEGQAHQPNFTFRVTVGDISCTGQGPSKKAAKHKAAEVALKLLKGGNMLEPAASEESRSSPMEVKSPVSPQQSECNPVGALQELVVQKGWRLPEYTVTQESGPAHRKEFTMTCRVERFIEIGSGTSKKLAKRNAAAKMLVRIHNVPMDQREGSEAEVEEDQFSITVGNKLDSLKGRLSGCTWDSLRNSAGEKILHLKSHPLEALNASFCSLLQELSEEQSFDISYLDIGSPPAPAEPSAFHCTVGGLMLPHGCPSLPPQLLSCSSRTEQKFLLAIGRVSALLPPSLHPQTRQQPLTVPPDLGGAGIPPRELLPHTLAVSSRSTILGTGSRADLEHGAAPGHQEREPPPWDWSWGRGRFLLLFKGETQGF